MPPSAEEVDLHKVAVALKNFLLLLVIGFASWPSRLVGGADRVQPLAVVALRQGGEIAEGARLEPIGPARAHAGFQFGNPSEPLLPNAVARVRRGARVGLLYGASLSPDFALMLVSAMRGGEETLTQEGGSVRASALSGLSELPDPDPDRANDTKALTPLLLMALLITGGLLLSVYLGSAPT